MSHEEFKIGLAKMGMEVTDTDFKQIMGLLDRENKGEIDYVRARAARG